MVLSYTVNTEHIETLDTEKKRKKFLRYEIVVRSIKASQLRLFNHVTVFLQ